MSPNFYSSNDLYTPDQVRELDRIAIEEYKIPALVLMKRAGRAAFCLLKDYWPEVAELQVFCGGGNNGGDGYVIAALAAKEGLPVTVWQLTPSLTGAAQQAHDYAEQEGATMKPFVVNEWTAAQANSNPLSVVVDALLGTGFSGELRPDYQQAISAINTAGFPVLSADIPSGINGETGAGEDSVKANVTISFIAQKVGNLTGKGIAHTGKRHLTDLEVPSTVFDAVTPCAHVLDIMDSLQLLPPRATDAHKGDFGHVLVVGGDHGFGGAVIMAAQMAMRSGAGLVSAATQAQYTLPLLSRQPEVMAVGVDSGLALLPLLEKPSVLVVGPGLGQSAWSEQLLLRCFESGKPMILDADALNLIAQKTLSLPKHQQWIMTPHPGEAARLLGVSITDIEQDRIAAAKLLQSTYGGVIVLKGAGTVVATSTQLVFICDAGNPGMASGGMGDVLAGLLGSLVGQKMSLDNAACLAVCLHSTAADMAAEDRGQRGLVATDLIATVADLLSE